MANPDGLNQIYSMRSGKFWEIHCTIRPYVKLLLVFLLGILFIFLLQ